MLHRTIRNDDFSATQRCNVGTMLEPFETTSQQCCSSVLRYKSSLRIVSFNITLKGDVTRDDSQRRFLVQHSVAMLEQCCNHSKQCRNNAVMLSCAKIRCCESSRVTSR